MLDGPMKLRGEMGFIVEQRANSLATWRRSAETYRFLCTGYAINHVSSGQDLQGYESKCSRIVK